ncbi:MAG: hypothetical protein VKJ06_02430, partial [Vampirovibrionales bacterium]|nr:hypothetical protein [Vampirovibrionales bacterium]
MVNSINGYNVRYDLKGQQSGFSDLTPLFQEVDGIYTATRATGMAQNGTPEQQQEAANILADLQRTPNTSIGNDLLADWRALGTAPTANTSLTAQFSGIDQMIMQQTEAANRELEAMGGKPVATQAVQTTIEPATNANTDTTGSTASNSRKAQQALNLQKREIVE